MIRSLLTSSLLVLALVTSAFAQTNISTTTCPGAGCVDFNVAQQGSIGIQITGTWSGTITFKASVKGGVGAATTEFVDLAVIPSNSATAVTTTTAVGSWSRNIAGYTTVRVQFTSYSSGTAVVSSRITLPSGNILSAAASGAPDSATYITQTANGSLSNEQALSTLSTGIMRVANATGIVTSLTTSAGISANISDETGTGLLTFATAPVFTTSIDLGATGVRVSDDSDGAITFLGLSAGADEDLNINLDDTSDRIVLSSSTSAIPLFSFSSIDFGTAGVKLSQDGDGALTILGMGNGSDEDLTLNFDDTANTVVVSSSTGVTVLSAPTIQASVLSVLLAPTLFAALGTPTDGTLIYCSDCTIANPCAGSGTGALAKRLNGVWVCN